MLKYENLNDVIRANQNNMKLAEISLLFCNKNFQVNAHIYNL